VRLISSVALLSLVAASLIGCAEPTPETPFLAPEPVANSTSEAAEKPAEQSPAEAPAREPTRASDSEYNHDITKATTSEGLTNADIAWHALNTYGWDCDEVVSREPQVNDYFVVACSSGVKLRVYPRAGQHPRITQTAAVAMVARRRSMYLAEEVVVAEPGPCSRTAGAAAEGHPR